jgi:hypothetical protein
VTEKINYMTVSEFQSEGYLHEVNRQVLHPLGIALEVRVPKKRKMKLRERVQYAWWVFRHGSKDGWISGIWDYRDDPEGMAYGEGTLSPEKAKHIRELWRERRHERRQRLGYIVQPAGRPLKGDS